MSQNLDVGIRITADGRVLVTEVKAAQAALNQIGETAKRTNTESAAAAERFTSNLKRQADTLGMTASQVRAYDAAQLKLNEAQRASVEASNRAITAFERQQAAAKSNVDVLGSIKSNLIAAGVAYVSYAGIMAGGKAIIDTALANERLTNTLKVATGSSEAAARETAFLREESEKLGLQFITTSGQYAKLAAATKGTALEGQATRDIFLGIAKASTVLGMSAEQSGGALFALQQMVSKGKVSAEELNGQLGERLPGALQIAARAMDMTTAELYKLMETGGLTAEQLLPALAAELEKTFGAQAQEAAQGLNAKINRLDNSFTDLKTSIGNTGLLDLLSDGIVLATRFVDALSGAKVLSAVDQQTQKIAAMRDELASLNNRKHFPLIGDLIFDKKQADLLEQRIEDGVADLAKLEKAAVEASEAMAGKKTITPGAKPALPDELVKEREKAAKNAETAAKKAADAKAREAKQALEDSAKIITALKRETQEVGLNSIQKRMLAAATEAARAPTKELAQEIMASAAAWGLATQKQEESLVLQKTQKEAAIERARSEKEAARQVQQEWRNTWGQVEQNAKMAFIQFAAHGKSAMQSIGEAIKFSIIDVLYQLTVRKWIINIGTSLESMVTSGSSSGSGGALNALFNGANLLNAGKTIFNGFTGSLTSGAGNLLQSAGRMIGSNALSTFGSGMLGMGATGASTAAFSAAGGAGTAFIGGAGTALGGSGMGAVATMGSTFAAAAGPLVAIAIADQLTRMFAGDKLIGGGVGKVLSYVPVIGGLLNGLFGHGPMKFRQQVAIGTASDEGFEGRVTDVWRAKGGLFVSNKHKEVAAGNQADLLDLFDTAIKGYSTSAKQFADNLSLSKDAITGYSKEIRLESEKGKTLTEEAIQGMLTSIGDDFARGLVPSIDELSRSGESAFATLTRLNTEFTTLVDAATLLGNSVADSKAFMAGTTFASRTAFVDAAGGTDALMQKAQFFAENFLNDAERLAPAQERLNNELGRLGLSTDLTKDQFGDLVQSFGHVNGISEEMLQALLNLAPAFLQVRNAADEAARANAELARAERLNAAGSAFSTLQKSVDAERKRITNDYDDKLDTVNTRIQAVTDSIGKLKTLSDALKSTVSQLRPLSRDQAKQQIQDAINAAKAGRGLPDAKDLQEALGTLGSQSPSGFSGSFEFAREQAKTANLVGELGGLADAQLTLEERSLKALESQRDRLDEGFKQETERLDSLLEQGQKEIDTLNGLNTAILSLTQAIGMLNLRSIQAGGGASIIDPLTGKAPVARDPTATDQAIRDYFNTPRTAQEIYKDARNFGVTSKDIVATGRYSQAEVDKFFRDNPDIPKFASGGFHRGGLRIVGERGPELEFTGPSRITSNNDLAKMLNNHDVVDQIKLLIQAVSQSTEFNRRVSTKLDDLTIMSNGMIALRTAA